MRNTYSTLTLDRARFANSLWLTPRPYRLQLSFVGCVRLRLDIWVKKKYRASRNAPLYLEKKNIKQARTTMWGKEKYRTIRNASLYWEKKNIKQAVTNHHLRLIYKSSAS